MSSRVAAFWDWLLLLLLLLPSTVGLVIYGSVRLWLTGPLIILTCVAGLALCVRTLLRRDPARILLPPGLVGMILLAGYAWGVSWRASVPFESVLESVRLSSYCVAYVGFCLLARPGARWRVLVAVFLVLASLLSCYAIVQHVNGSTMVLLQQRPEQYGMRASGSFVCPNHLANVLQVAIVFGASIFWIRRSGWFLRIFSGYAIVVSLPVLLLTESRSGWIGVAVGLAVLGVLASLRTSWRRAAATAVFMPLLVVLVGAVLWFHSSTFHSRVEEALRGNVRVQLWKDTLEAIRDEPVWGHGPGSFRWIYPQYKDALRGSSVPRYAHNEYLELAAESGAIGVALMAITVFSFSIPLVLRIRSASSKQEAMLVAGLLASLAGSAAHAFFDFNLSIFAIVHVLIMLSGVVAARLYDAGDLKGIPLGRGPARGLALVVGAILAAIATWTGRATASYLLADASESVQTDLQRLETAQALGAYAIQADPRYWRAHEAYAAALQARARWYFDPAGKRELARQAIASYEEVLRLNPYGNHTRLLLSRVYRDLLKQPERGVQILRELVADAPKVSVYHAELGAHLWQMGQEEEALAAFQDALRMDPRDSDVRLQRKRLRESMGKNASSK